MLCDAMPQALPLSTLGLGAPLRRPTGVHTTGAVASVSILGSFGDGSSSGGSCVLAALDVVAGAIRWRWGGGCPAGQAALAGGAIVFSRRRADGGATEQMRSAAPAEGPCGWPSSSERRPIGSRPNHSEPPPPPPAAGRQNSAAQGPSTAASTAGTSAALPAAGCSAAKTAAVSEPPGATRT